MAHRFNKAWRQQMRENKQQMKADIDTLNAAITALDSTTLGQTRNICKDICRIEKRLIKDDLHAL